MFDFVKNKVVEGEFVNWMVVVTTLEVVRNVIFINLKVPTWSAKIVEKEDAQ
jgi:hypothetical protein